MRANPGGVLAPADVIGRDSLIQRLWRVLEAQSIVLTSERRIGKTSVIRKMVNEVGANTICLLRDIEDLRSPNEFIAGIYADVQSILSKKERAKLAVWGLLEKFGGTEIGDLKLPQFRPHWKNLLAALFADIFSAETRPVIFFWDELPLFLYNVKTNAGEQDAMELLDALRALRQKYPSLRMIFTGSVGIHQIVGTLRQYGYANDPTNDMAIIEVPPLDPEDGAHLARMLLSGEGIGTLDDPAKVSNDLSTAAGHIPYYIHCLVSRISNEKTEIHSDDVASCLKHLLCDPNDPAHFYYYQTRLTTYYGSLEASIALNILDILARSERPMSFSELANLARHNTNAANDEQIRSTLQILLKDHYLFRLADGHYSFRYSIVQRWWAYTRG